MDMVYGYIRKVYISLDQGTVCLALFNGKPVRFGTNLFTHPFIPGVIKKVTNSPTGMFLRDGIPYRGYLKHGTDQGTLEL